MNFFNFGKATQTFGPISFNYPTVTSGGAVDNSAAGISNTTGGNLINVLQNFRWKNSVGASTIDEVPYIILSEYTLSYGMWAQNLFSILKNYTNGSKTNRDPYGTIYFGDNSASNNFIYVLPYIVKPGSSIRGDLTNSWSEINNPTSSMAGAVLGNAAKGAIESIDKKVSGLANFAFTGYGQEKVSSYAGTNEREITIEFPLYNTTSTQDAINNFSFVNLFYLQNLKTRTSYLTYKPPKLYTVDTYSLGGIYIPASYVSGYSIKSIGTTRRFKDLGLNYGGSDGVSIPEAYKVSIRIKELLPESVNIIAGALGGDKVSVVSNPINYSPVSSETPVINGRVVIPQ
jgi:hypothetical protein